MNDKFVPHPLALKLKELGLNVQYFGNYYLNEVNQNVNLFTDFHTDTIRKRRNIKHLVGAPLWSDAFDWFRDTHKLSGEPQSGWFSFEYKIIKDTLGENQCIATKKDFNTYKEARLACLENLIELLWKNIY